MQCPQFPRDLRLIQAPFLAQEGAEASSRLDDPDRVAVLRCQLRGVAEQLLGPRAFAAPFERAQDRPPEVAIGMDLQQGLDRGSVVIPGSDDDH